MSGLRRGPTAKAEKGGGAKGAKDTQEGWRIAVALVFGWAACRPAPGPMDSAPFELRAVVRTAVAELEARIPAPVEPAELGEEDRERAEGLLAMLADSDARLAEVALEDARALADAGVAFFARALADETLPTGSRRAAARALGAIGTPRAAEVLCAELEGASDPWLRGVCAWQLGEAGQDQVLPRMVLRLKYEKDGETVVWLARAAALLGSYAGLDGLLFLRSSGASEELRALAAARLDELAQEAGAATGEELQARWNSAAAGELSLRAPSERLRLETWRRVAGLAEWSLRTVDDSRFALAHGAPWVAEVLAAALHDENVYVRVHAAQCLERMGPRASVSGAALIEALREPRLAPAAATALAGLGYEPAGVELDRVLAGPHDLELRIAAAAALGRLGAAVPRAALRRAFAETEPLDLRQVAARSLLALDDEVPTASFLRGCLTDPSADSAAAELALEAWLTRRAELEPEVAALLERWRALTPAPDSIPSSEETARRQDMRAELLARAESVPGPRKDGAR